MSFSINFLSATTSGQPIFINTTATPGTPIHTGIAGSSQIDEVFLYANNTGLNFYPLVLEVAGTATGNRVSMLISPQDSPQLVLQGWPINQSAVIRAFSPSGGGFISIGGYVQRGP